MNINTISKQNFGKVYIKSEKPIEKELAQSTASFRENYEKSLKAAEKAEICDVLLTHNGKVVIFNNADKYSTEVKGFSTPLNNFVMALRTVNMMESLSKGSILV